MILLILLVAFLVAAAGAVLLGIGVLSESRRRQRSALAAVSAPVVLVAGIAALAALVLGIGGRQSDNGPGPGPEAPTSALAQPQRTQPLPTARIQTVTSNTPVVRIQAVDQDRFSPYRPVSGLTAGAVVRVQAEGFDRSERGHIEQCVSELGRQTACSEAFPVQFDDRGRADLQFAVRDDVAPGECRVGQATCLLRVTGDRSRQVGTVQTVVADRLTPGSVRVEPARALVDGQTVVVSVTGFPAGTTATAVLCAPPEAYDALRCSAPVTASSFTVDAAGEARVTIAVSAGRLGADAAPCGPRRSCGVAVLVGPGFIAAPAAPISFSTEPGVDYKARRLVPGVAAALMLLALALGLAARTDWAKPTEAASPDLDRADLRADQNLDELFGTDAELDERDPIPR